MSYTSNMIRAEANSKEKEIYIMYTDRQKEIKTVIKLTETVKGLKKKIVKLFNLSPNFLDNHKLRVKYPGMRNGKILADDSKTLEYYHIKNESLFIFSKEENQGGKYFV